MAFLLILLVSLVAMAGAGVVHATAAGATVQVIGNPTNLVYDSGRGEVFVLYAGSGGAGGVQSIHDSNNTAGGYAGLGLISSLAYDPAKGEVFVSLGGQNMVAIVNDLTLAVKDVSVGQNPGGMAYDSGAGELFVANRGSDTVSVISDSSSTVVANISVAATPLAVAYDSATNEVFVANYGPNAVNQYTVTVLSDASLATSSTATSSTTPVTTTTTSMATPTTQSSTTTASSTSFPMSYLATVAIVGIIAAALVLTVPRRAMARPR
ncbi:MAG: hypothetical protein ABSG45_04495 [Nitrososphaerales archaeon]